MKRITVIVATMLTFVMLVGPISTLRVVAQSKVVEPMDRTILPIPEPKVANSTVFNARNATAPPRFEVKAPEGAPNGTFWMAMRLYWPKEEALNGEWTAPPLKREQ